MGHEALIAQLNDCFNWMRETALPCGYMEKSVENYKLMLSDIDKLESSEEMYEVHVDIHLINGKVLKLRNNCISSYLENRYRGDEIGCEENGLIHVYWEHVGGTFHQSHFMADSVCWIDSYNKDICWDRLKRITRLRLHRLEKNAQQTISEADEQQGMARTET